MQAAVLDGQLTLSVQGNGIGMLSELVDMAFELFSQGKRSADHAYGGLRIGPALVRSLIQLHGGSAALYSAGVGLGSKVTVLLPSLQQGDKLPCVDADDAGGAPACQPLRIWWSITMLTRRSCWACSWNFLDMRCLCSFIPSTPSNARARCCPTFACLTLVCPTNGGYTLARQLRLIPGVQTTILAAVTGYSQSRDKQAAFAAGFDFAKPIDSQQLKTWPAGIAAQPTLVDA